MLPLSYPSCEEDLSRYTVLSRPFLRVSGVSGVVDLCTALPFYLFNNSYKSKIYGDMHFGRDSESVRYH